jgi:replicative DNA helicase
MAKALKVDVRDVVYSPNDAANEALATIEERRSAVGVGVRLGVKCVDEYLQPARPGQLFAVIGMTSNYKTGLMTFWARSAAQQIAKEKDLNQAVIYVTWESAIEELLALDLAATLCISVTDIFQGRITDAQMEDLRASAFKRATVPTWIIGHSIKEGKKRPRLTLTVIGQALQHIQKEYGIRPRAIFLDYLQQMETEQGEDRRMQVFHNVYRCKDMSYAMRCPVVVGTQAKRETYAAGWGVPGVADSLETSNLEHTADAVLGVWLPKTGYEVGTLISQKGGGKSLEVTENLLILKVLKQRMGPAGRWWALYVDASRNFIGEMETRESVANKSEVMPF